MKKSRNKGKLPVLAAVCFYVVAGSAICIILFLKGISFSGDISAALNSLKGGGAGLFETFSGAVKGGDSPEGAVAETETSDSNSNSNSESAPAESETQEAQTQEPETNKEAEAYYAFTTTTVRVHLNVRQSGSMNAKIISSLAPKTSGYVLEKGPTWSLIQSGNITGYAFNEYLEFREISKEEFKEKFPERFSD